MLGGSFQEGSSAPGGVLEIQVTDVEPSVLYAALRWVYTDQVDADLPAHQLLQVSFPNSNIGVLYSVESSGCLCLVLWDLEGACVQCH